MNGSFATINLVKLMPPYPSYPFAASPNESPKSSHKHSPPSDHQSPKGIAPDTVTLSAISQRGCICVGSGKGEGPLVGRPTSSGGPVDLKCSPDVEDVFHHTAPISSTTGGRDASDHHIHHHHQAQQPQQQPHQQHHQLHHDNLG